MTDNISAFERMLDKEIFESVLGGVKKKVNQNLLNNNMNFKEIYDNGMENQIKQISQRVMKELNIIDDEEDED